MMQLQAIHVTENAPKPPRPLTARQRAKVKELEEISKIACIDFWNIENANDDNDVINIILDLARDRIIRADVVFSYVLIDELLNDLIVGYFFDPKKSSFQLWKTQKFAHFNYHILEGLSLLRKLALVKEVQKIPKPIDQIITATNVVRNAVAHSFFPMNKREFRHTQKCTYKGKDIFTLDGLKVFDSDVNRAVGFLSHLAHGTPLEAGVSNGSDVTP
jgi:hypothetical protein